MVPMHLRSPHFRERSFGLSVGGVLLIIASVLVWRGRLPLAASFGAIGALLMLLGRVRPSLLKWPSAAWWRVALILGYVNARIILTIAFTLILIPIGLIWRMIGRDPLARRRDHWTGWLPRPARYQATDHYTRMF